MCIILHNKKIDITSVNAQVSTSTQPTFSFLVRKLNIFTVEEEEIIINASKNINKSITIIKDYIFIVLFIKTLFKGGMEPRPQRGIGVYVSNGSHNTFIFRKRYKVINTDI